MAETITNPTAEDVAMQAASKQAMDAEDTVAGIVVLKLYKNGHVRRYTVDRIERPRSYWMEATEALVAILQRSFNQLTEMGLQCNCAKCIAERGGVFNSNINAQA